MPNSTFLPAKPLTPTSESPPSVAICYPSGRVSKLTIPLIAADIPVEVAPDNPCAHDVIILDQSSKEMLIPIIRSDNDTPVLYRVRGNLWRSSKYSRLGRLKSKISDKNIFPRLDGALIADSWLETEWQNRTGNTMTTTIGLAVQPGEWSPVSHTDRHLRLLTLTNADYRGKVDPIIEWMNIVDEVLDELGGQWTIGGSGRFEESLGAAAARYDHIQFGGYVDAKEQLPASNVLLHPSMFDIQLPNAILEGMATSLPIVTTSFPPFAAHDRLLSADSKTQLRNTLYQLHNPIYRQQQGERNLAYVRNEHSPEEIGSQYREFLERFN